MAPWPTYLPPESDVGNFSLAAGVHYDHLIVSFFQFFLVGHPTTGLFVTCRGVNGPQSPNTYPMLNNLRTLLIGTLALTGVTAMAQGHYLSISGHLDPCTPANEGSPVSIEVYGNTSGPISATTTLNPNCYYTIDLLVPDSSGVVFVGAICSDGTFAQDSTWYSVAGSNEVIVDLNCGSQASCTACISFEQTAPFAAVFSSCSNISGSPELLWDFSDGGAVPGDDIAHTFSGAGTYTVCLNLINDPMCQDFICQAIYVDAQGNISTEPPVSNCAACFNIVSTAPWTATFVNCSSGDAPMTYTWWLPDGSGSSAVNADWLFTTEGTYGVCLTMADASGCTSTLCDTAYVDANGGISTDPPAPCFACYSGTQAYDDQGVAIPFTVVLTDCSSGGAGQYFYQWAPSTSSNWEGSIFITGPLTFGADFTYCMRITDGSGCQSETCNTFNFDANGILITDSVVYDCLQIPNGPNMPGTPCDDNDPTTMLDMWTEDCVCAGMDTTTVDCYAGFFVMQAYQWVDSAGNPNGGGGEPIPNELWLWNLSGGGTGIFQFTWSWGDGTSSTTAFPSHTYAGSGTYTICLTINDNEGCTDTYCQEVTVDNDGIYNGMMGSGSRSTFTIHVMNPLALAVNELPTFSGLNAWPNPVNEVLNLSLESRLQGLVNIAITDLSGRMVRTEARSLNGGANTLEVTVDALQPGMYLITIGDGPTTVSERFVKVR